MANLMICENSSSALRRSGLNESAGAGGNYILEGVFAQLDTLNRNQRVYPKEEYLKHLQYLRDDLKKGEPLLGELDHPDDRFEVKLKDASHRVLDLWYDPNQNVIMGKIQLLNTPNGKLAQSLVDQGVPLHISSRASGTVNKDNTVSIQQIYTYDLVAKPGFADAVLHCVNESAATPAYTEDVRSFLNSSVRQESLNAAPQYGILNENISVTEISAAPVLRKEAKDLQINRQTENTEDMTKQILENDADSTVGKPLDISGNGAAAAGVPTADSGFSAPVAEPPANEEEDTDASKDDSASASDDSDASSEEKADDKEKDVDTNGVEILDVKAVSGDDGDEKDSDKGDSDDDMIKDVKKADDNEDKEPDTGSGDQDDDSGSRDQEESNESEDEEVDKGCTSGCKDDKIEKKATEANRLNDEAKEDIDKRRKSFDKKFDDLIDAIKEKGKSKSESACESMTLVNYPVSAYMTEKNFTEFASLSESQKENVVAYLQDTKKFTPQQINESWKDGIGYTPSEPVWLKYAPAEYRAMYESADQATCDALGATAEFVLFESQRDVNTFWENSGLKNRQERKMLNESFLNSMPKVAAAPKEEPLPYGKSFIEQITDMACEYNSAY